VASVRRQLDDGLGDWQQRPVFEQTAAAVRDTMRDWQTRTRDQAADPRQLVWLDNGRTEKSKTESVAENRNASYQLSIHSTAVNANGHPADRSC
jgi:hypothetical protein